MHLIFLHLFRLSLDTARTRFRLHRVIVAEDRERHPRFRLDIEERQSALEALFNDYAYEIPLNASLSVRNLWARSSQIEEILNARIDSEQLGRFVDWLLDNVVMAGIEAIDRDNGFRIFESMNDRGARLTPVDLVKSFLLSKAGADQENLNKSWREMLSRVTRIRGDSKAPLEYLKAVLLARFADLTEGSTDANEIGLAPHVWLRGNTDRLGLRPGDDSYSRFVEDLVSLGDHYADLAAATTRPYTENNLASLYYNHVNGLTSQMALIMGTVEPGDTRTQAEKARIAANFVDLLYVVNAVHDKPTHPEDLNEEIVRLIPLARTCSTADELAVRLGRETPSTDFDTVRTFGLRGDNRGPVRYVLARLTAYVEDEMKRPVKIEEYLSADRSWHRAPVCQPRGAAPRTAS